MSNPHHLGPQGDKLQGKSISKSESMKIEYDFLKAEHGKFYRPDAIFSFPVYLESDVNDFLSKLAEQKKIDVQDLVNDLLRANMKLI